MSTRRDRDFLKVQIIETERMLKEVGEHPIMSVSLKTKLQALKRRLDQLPVDQKEAKVALFFSGNPVFGSLGIDASFIGNVLLPFQNMVKSDIAKRKHGKVGERGRINDEEQSRLFLTALPRGSFGIELSKIDDNSKVTDDQMADSLSHITKLIDSCGRSDEDFAAELDEIAPRTLSGLTEFLKVISDDNAGLLIESGGIRCNLEPNDVKTAYERAIGTKSDEKEVEITGILDGILLDSWRFDFIDDQGAKISGTIDDKITKDILIDYVKSFFSNTCIARLNKTTVLFRNGREKISYELLSIRH